jgi:hypothetical protein
MRKKLLLLILFSLMLISSAFGAEQIIVNSKDWQDVYSGTQYGFLAGVTPKFLVGPKHSTIILNEIPQTDSIRVFSSRRNPFVTGYESTIEANGFEVEEQVFNTLSLDLAEELTDIEKFIIVDDSYGYNAVAVAPYAIISKSYVLFADRTNIDDVVNFFEDRVPSEVIIYGTVDREVIEGLDPYSPEIINDEGDRFANNVEIVKRFKQYKDAKQVVLSNGEFIENEIMSGNHPVLFIGRDNVPDKIKEYITSSNIEVGVLIGNDLVGAATTVRRQTGISTFVKFGRSARNPDGPVSEIEDLDLFRIPRYDVQLGIQSIRYNALTRQIEVTLENQVDLAAYFKGTYTIRVGDRIETIGDAEAIFIDANDVKTAVYDIEPIAEEGDIVAEVFVTFGESPASLEFILQGEVPVERVEVLDDTAIAIEKVVFDKTKGVFLVYIQNTGGEKVYVETEVVDFIVVNQKETFGSEEIISISTGGKGTSKVRPIDLEISEADLEDNPTVKVRAYYGERENGLVKVLEQEFEVEIKSFDIWTYVPVVIIIILILLIFFGRKKKKKDKK